MCLIIRESSTPQCHQLQSRQNERTACDLGSPEHCRIPAPPPSGTTFHEQQYNNLPDNIVMGIQRTQTLEQESARARCSVHGHRGGRGIGQQVLGVSCCQL